MEKKRKKEKKRNRFYSQVSVLNFIEDFPIHSECLTSFEPPECVYNLFAPQTATLIISHIRFILSLSHRLFAKELLHQYCLCGRYLPLLVSFVPFYIWNTNDLCVIYLHVQVMFVYCRTPCRSLIFITALYGTSLLVTNRLAVLLLVKDLGDLFRRELF